MYIPKDHSETEEFANPCLLRAVWGYLFFYLPEVLEKKCRQEGWKCYNIEKPCCGYVHTHALAYTVTDIHHRYVYTHRYAFHRHID